MVPFKPLTQAATNEDENRVIEGRAGQSLRSVVYRSQRERNEGNVAIRARVCIERTAAQGTAELAKKELAALSVSFAAVVRRAGDRPLRWRRSARVRWLWGIEEHRLRKAHGGCAVGEGVVDAPDQNGAVPRGEDLHLP
jgi:hypothetical protein